jgi:hypothetical protein
VFKVEDFLYIKCPNYKNFIFGWNIENIFSSEFELI